MTNKKTRPTLNLTVSLIVILAAWITPWAHAAETTNRIAANRIAANRIAANRIAANRIAANRIAANKISFNRLQANSEADEILGTADGRELYSYIVSCALPEKESIETKNPGAQDKAPPDTKYTISKDHSDFPGSYAVS